MNTKQFQYVITLQREGSFSKAAEVLGITQPSLSQYVKKIENELGFPLFDRTGGDVRLTDAGRVYVDSGRKILDLERQMENAFSDISTGKSGSLVIGAAPYRAAGMLPSIAVAFRRIRPGIHLVVREGTTAELAEGVEHGEYDLAITLLPVDGRMFSYEKVLEEELVLAVPASFPALPAKKISGRKYPAIKAGALKGQKLVMLTNGQYMQSQLKAITFEQGIELSAAAVVKSLEAQIEFVKAGIGMALTPSGIDRFCKPGEVTFYSFEEDFPRREAVIMWRKDRKLSKNAQELKNVILSIDW